MRTKPNKFIRQTNSVISSNTSIKYLRFTLSFYEVGGILFTLMYLLIRIK